MKITAQIERIINIETYETIRYDNYEIRHYESIHGQVLVIVIDLDEYFIDDIYIS